MPIPCVVLGVIGQVASRVPLISKHCSLRVSVLEKVGLESLKEVKDGVVQNL